MYKTSNEFIEKLISRTPGEIEFHQAVKEVVESIWDFVLDNPQYLHSNIIFKRVYVDDQMLGRIICGRI